MISFFNAQSSTKDGVLVSKRDLAFGQQKNMLGYIQDFLPTGKIRDPLLFQGLDQGFQNAMDFKSSTLPFTVRSKYFFR